MECKFSTEAELVSVLLATAKLHDDNPIVVVSKRVSGKNTVNREVTVVIRVASGNEDLVNALERLAVDSGLSLWFEGSEINLQDGQMSIDYLYVNAIIKPIV